MSFDSIAFPIFALIAISAIRFCPPGLAKKLALLLLSLIFIGSFAGSPTELVPLFAFIAFGYLIILFVSKVRHPVLIGLSICLIIAVFVWLKQYTIAAMPRLHFVYATIGISYILFRIVHLIVDVSQDATKVPSVLTYLCYTTFFLTLVSGPIELFNSFSDQIQQPPVPMTRGTLGHGLARALSGYLFLFTLAAPLASIARKLQAALYVEYDNHALFMVSWIHAAAAMVYLFYLYFNFAAYMDIVIGIGILAGFALSENFDRPFDSENFLDLWNRWHMSLSRWFRLYLFNPLLKEMAARWGNRVSINHLGAVAFFVTFGVMGLWHGTTGTYAIYGLALATAATLNKLWQVELVARLGKGGYKGLCKQTWYQNVSRSSTLAYFAMALTCLWIVPDRAIAFTKPITWVSTGLAFASLTGVGVCVTTAQSYWRTSRRQLNRISLDGRDEELGKGRRFHSLAWNITMVCIVLLLALVMNGYAPDIVYKGF